MINSLNMLKAWIVARTAKNEDGATMVEYGLVVAVVAIIALVGAKLVGIELNTLFDTISGEL